MAESPRPLSPKDAPDPSKSYERARPEDVAGTGRLDSDPAIPPNEPDHMKDAITNAQPPRQLNAHDGIVNERVSVQPGEIPSMPPPAPVDHSMLEEEPDGWDLAPQDIKDPKFKRHPKTE